MQVKQAPRSAANILLCHSIFYTSSAFFFSFNKFYFEFFFSAFVNPIGAINSNNKLIRQKDEKKKEKENINCKLYWSVPCSRHYTISKKGR